MEKGIKKIKGLLSDVHISELVKGGGASFILRVLSLIFGFVFNWMIAHFYGAESLGFLISSISVLTLVALIPQFGLDTAFLRFVSEYNTKKQPQTIALILIKSLSVMIPLGVVVTVAFYFSAGYIATVVFKKPYLAEHLRYISFGIVPMAMYFLFSEGLRGLKKIKEQTIIQNPSRFFISMILILFSVYILGEKINPSLIFSVSIILTMFLSIYYWRKFFILQNEVQKNAEQTTIAYSEIFKLSVPLLLASSTSFMVSWTDTIVLTMYRSDEEVAVYNTAMKFSTFAKLNLLAINSIAAPKFVELFSSKNFTALQKVAKQTTKLVFWTSIPATLIMLIFPSFILGIYGDIFKTGTSSLVILVIAQFIGVTCGSVGYFLQMTGSQKLFQNIILGVTALNILLNFLLIPSYGMQGAAIAGFITIVLQNVVSVYFIKRKYGFWLFYIPFLSKVKKD